MNALQHAVQYLHKIRRGALLTKNTTFLLYSSLYPHKKNPHTDSFLSTPAELKSKAIKLFPPSLLPGSYQLELIPVCATCKFQKLLWEACFYWNKNKNKAKLAAHSYWFRDPECICLLPFLHYSILKPQTKINTIFSGRRKKMCLCWETTYLTPVCKQRRVGW